MTKQEKAEDLEDEKQRKKLKRVRDREMKKYIGLAKEESELRLGRPLSLTWVMLMEIKQKLWEGQFQKYVFESMGISKTAWERWKIRGSEVYKMIQDKDITYTKLNTSEEKYLYFRYLVDSGKGKAIERNMKNIQNAGKTDWRASAWFLEVVDRENYGKHIEANIKGEVNMSNIMDAYLKRKAEKAGEGE